ncbi:putative protein kinase RLK-Pelle-LRR-XII-1 family [Rosa chinensis]|uniref:non-specific serine/threonine protein kinase n=2 Tax=Rosa chinensis TaxID=74649 RepID=A0A2P6QTJ6_ROSCH|nr:putative protein kinase RLK-Pelle-LRR-XII-1 family [Rosa chinensis]
MRTMFMEKLQTFLFGVALLHYSCFLKLAISSPSNFTDQSALLAIQSQITFDPTNTVLGGGSWITKTSFCNWFGVSCSKRRQRVTALDLSYMNLQGTISPHVGNLSFLISLDLRNNSFLGFIPHEISRLHRLRILVLQGNKLEGNIPPTLQLCHKLESISLSINILSGLIPKELGFLPRVRKLYLGANNLTGEIPSSLGNISTLQELSLVENGLTGSFPSALLNVSTLALISLSGNYMSGSLPVDLCRNWPNTYYISLSDNKFGGQLTFGISQCRELEILSLSYNNFVGSIPGEIGSLQHLKTLFLGVNNLTGAIPPTIGNLSNLQFFTVPDNNLEGSIPSDLGHLSKLNYLSFARNSLTGEIPESIFNISSLNTLQVQTNALSGEFPSRAMISNLNTLYCYTNHITGNLPSYFSNLSQLVELDVSNNSLYGPIPMNLGSSKYLEFLNLGGNQLSGEPGVPVLRFLSSIFNSSSLKHLFLSRNPLDGIMPDSFGNFSYSLEIFFATACQIKGPIPKTIQLLKNLTFLALSDNNISGKIPSSIGALEMLQRLYLENNKIEGLIPNELCLLRNLGDLSLGNNQISGSIPNCIANLSRIQRLLLSSNRLTSAIPVNLWNLKNLLFLNLSSNIFSGYLPPSMKRSVAVQMVDLSDNQVTGNISSIVGAFPSINSLSLANNLFIGSLPQTLGDLKGLEFLDLSNNNLSGPIPKSLETLKYLNYLNLSFNQLSGEIPSSGAFIDFTALSFLENRGLCGRPEFGVPPCMALGTQKSKMANHLLKYVLPGIASTMILIALIYMVTKCRKRDEGIPSSVQALTTTEHRMMSYHQLRRATNGFCESNLLGVGSFGSVYKGILTDGTIVAVKVLNLQMEGAFKSFDAECKVWRRIRHRNLVKIMTTCSNHEVRALVLQYMSNGSLEKWLYSHNYCLTLLQRVAMLIDIALALDYLHHGQSEGVVHCDLKPSNILLDEDMVAHVGDFGLAKIIAINKDATQTRTLGTLGYVAPEYGSAGVVSARGDIYSFGIMLMEIIVRKKPTDEMFAGELTLRQWINASLPDSVLEVVDAGLLSIEDETRDMNATVKIILSILEIGLGCSEEVAQERINIKDVVPKLTKIKCALEDRNGGVYYP